MKNWVLLKIIQILSTDSNGFYVMNNNDGSVNFLFANPPASLTLVQEAFLALNHCVCWDTEWALWEIKAEYLNN